MRVTELASRLCRFGALAVVVLTVVCGVWTKAAQTQDTGASDWDGSGSDSECVPRCRGGYECRYGECLPVCTPACGPGYLCTAGGTCVRTEAPPPVHSSTPTWGSQNARCLPSCRSGYVCLGGQCVSACNPICPPGEMCTEQGECVPGVEKVEVVEEPEPTQSISPAETEAAPAAPYRSPSADSIVNLHFDALGILQFGLTPTLELGKKVSGYLRLRPLNTGLMSYFLLAPDEGDTFKWGLGSALGMHIFSAGEGNMRGVFGGPSLEYIFVKSQNVDYKHGVFRTHVLMPQLDLGYRWGFDSFLLGLGGRVGVSIPVAVKDDAIGGLTCNECGDRPSPYFFGGLFVDIGVFL